jgi:hypothetical protein
MGNELSDFTEIGKSMIAEHMHFKPKNFKAIIIYMTKYDLVRETYPDMHDLIYSQQDALVFKDFLLN